MAQTPPPIPSSNRPYADEISKFSGSLTHVFLNPSASGGTQVFVNGSPVSVAEFESLSVEIVAPDESQDGTLAAGISRYPAGGGAPQGVSLFPGTVEVIGTGKRLSISCDDPGSFDGLYLRFGVGDDGTGVEASGVARFRLVITPDLRDARLTWIEDGREDVIVL